MQVRQSPVVLFQHQEHRVQEVDQLADVEQPAGVGEAQRTIAVGHLDRVPDVGGGPTQPELTHHVVAETHLQRAGLGANRHMTSRRRKLHSQ